MSLITDTDVDFTPEERGRFRQPETVGDHSYAELEAMVFAALAKNIRTAARIRAHAGLDPKFDISVVLIGMMIDEKIREFAHGSLTAYFLFTEWPTRVWNNGDGTIGAELEKNFTPRYRLTTPTREAAAVKAIDPDRLEELAATTARVKDIAYEFGMDVKMLNRQIKKLGLRGRYDDGRRKFARERYPEQFIKAPATADEPVKPKQEKIMQTATANATTIGNPAKATITRSAATPISEYPPISEPEKAANTQHDAKASSRRRPKVMLTVTQILEAAKTGKTLKDVAKLLGLSQPVFSKKLKANDDFQKAYETGRKEYFAKHGTGRATRLGSSNTETARAAGAGRLKTEIDLVDLENAAAKFGNKQRVADAVGVSLGTLYSRLKNSETAKAYERGLAQFVGEGDEKPEPRKVETPVISRDCPDCGHTVFAGRDHECRPPKSSLATKDNIADINISNEMQKQEPPKPEPARKPLVMEIDEAETIETKPLLVGDKGPEIFGPAFEIPIERFSDIDREAANRLLDDLRIDKALGTYHWTDTPFNDGSRIVVGFDGNLFDMSARDRKYLNHVIDIVQGGPDAVELIAGPPPRRTFLDRIRSFFA